MQITKAMELVATSKLRRAKERVERARPFRNLLDRAIKSVSQVDGFAECVFAAERSKKTLVVVLAGDRGLAGGYNANVWRTVTSLSINPEDTVILPIGKKTHEYYSRRSLEMLDMGLFSISDIGVGECLDAAKRIVTLVLEEKIGRVILVYTKFKSMISQVPTCETILPLSVNEEVSAASVQEPLLEEDPEAFLTKIMPDYIGGAIWSAVCEALASESGARRTSMNAANKNASEMIDSLMLKYNRARQSVITQEITEIVSGAEAL